MTVTRRLVSAAGLAAAVGLAAHAGPQPGESPRAGVPVEVRFFDGGVLLLRVRDEKVEFTTRYGTLQIPFAEVRRVELATRVPPEAAARISAAVADLGHPDFRARVRAEAELKEFQSRAYQPLLKAAKHPEPEVARRAESLVQYLRAQVPAADLQVRDHDAITTDDGRFTGRLAADAIRVRTAQFGDQTLKLADIREIRPPGTPARVASSAGPAPANMMQYQGQFGTEMDFTLTGTLPGQVQVFAPPPALPVAPPGAPGLPAPVVVMAVGGPQPNQAVWGTDVYTLDSHLPTAAVHAGVAQPGQSVTVRVRVVAPPAAFLGSSRNGVTTANFPQFPPGAYEFVRP